MYAWSGIEAATQLSRPLRPFPRPQGRTAPSDAASYAEVATPLRGLGSIVQFPRSAVIFRERDHASAIYRVVSGAIALSRTTNRKRRIIDFRFAGEFFGVVHRPEYTTDAEATADCVLLSYRRGNVDAIVDELPQFRRSLTGLLTERVQFSGDNAESYTARERIEAFLRSLSKRIPRLGEVDLPLSADDIADRLDVSPAAVECVLRTLTNPEAMPEINA